jgi:hypothetical protein
VLGAALDRYRTLVNPIAWCKRAERGVRKVGKIAREILFSGRMCVCVRVSTCRAWRFTLNFMFPIFRGIYASGHLELPPCGKRERERGGDSRAAPRRGSYIVETQMRETRRIRLNYSPLSALAHAAAYLAAHFS